MVILDITNKQFKLFIAVIAAVIKDNFYCTAVLHLQTMLLPYVQNNDLTFQSQYSCRVSI